MGGLTSEGGGSGGDGTRFTHGDLENDRMTFADQGLLVLRQPGQKREFLALHRRLDAPQAGAAHRHLVRGEDQAQVLFPAVTRHF